MTFIKVFSIMMGCASAGLFVVSFFELLKGRRSRSLRGASSFRKTMAISIASFIAYGGLIAGVSYALYDEEKKEETANNHVQAGNLTLSAQMISLEGKRLNASGLLEDFFEEKDVNLNTDAAPLFSIDSFVPGQNQTAKVVVTNTGDVAFECTVLLVGLKVNKSNDIALAEQLRVEIASDGGEKTSFLLCDLYSETSVADFGNISPDESKTFSVSVKFENTSDNNAAKLGKVEFDVQIRAVQNIG